MKKIEAVILDWAGTTVDYGCFAPVNAFVSAFAEFGISVDVDEVRMYMGMAKKTHIEKMFEGSNISQQWQEKYGRTYTSDDIENIYARFEPALFATLRDHAEPIAGVIEAAAAIREMGIAIGSTTGYTRAMMDVVAPAARDMGYAPDRIVCPEDTGGMGRPYPYMLWRNLETLGITSIHSVIKAGDTAADMLEGKNAGCLCVGIIKGSSMLGKSQDEVSGMSESEYAALAKSVKERYLSAGADYVFDNIGELPSLIEFINYGGV